MAYFTLTRNKAWEFNGSGEVGKDDYVRVNGTQYGRFGFDLSGLRTALGDRQIKVTQLQFEWNTSAKFYFDCYFNTSSSSDGTYAGTSKGTSSTYMAWTGFSTTDTALFAMLQTKINTTNDNDVYFTLHKSGDPKGTGNCAWGSIVVYYELGAPKQTDVVNDITVGSEVVSAGGNVSYSIEAYNTKSSQITSAKVELFCVSNGSNIKVAEDSTYSVSIESYKTKTFSGTATIYNNLSLPRGSQIKMKLTLTGTSVSANQTVDFAKLIDKYYSPTINAFSLWRCSNIGGAMQRDNSGINLMTDLQIGLDAASSSGFTLKAYYRENGDVDDSVTNHINMNLDVNFSDLIAGVSDNTSLFAGNTFSNSSAWFFRLVLTDGIETAKMDISVPKSFANFHLAGLATGGAAFGRFSTSTSEEAKLETEYKFYPLGGINGCDYSTSETQTPFKWIDNKPIYRKVITYSTAIGGSTYVDIPIGINVTDFGTLVSMNGHMVQQDSASSWEIKQLSSTYPGGADTSALITFLYKTTSSISARVATGSAYGTYNVISVVIILEYTKTDTTSS